MSDISKCKEQWPKAQLILGEDYYIEDGMWVFTEKYHRDRNYCCGNKCRHCPFEHKNVN